MSPRVRGTATWMQVYDDRLLERLKEEGWSTTPSLATAVDLPTGMTRERLRLLADAGLVAFATNDYDLVHLTTSGALYLEGERDQAKHPHPLDIRRATKIKSDATEGVATGK